MLSAERIMQRCDELARFTESAPSLTRVFLSEEHRQAADCVMRWMRQAGMEAHLDAMGNVVGRYEAQRPAMPAVMLGSHLDTVRNAGRYDGMLGVVTAIECVQALNDSARRLPFAVDVVGFGDEEGVRFGATLLGSRAVAGTFDGSALDTKDGSGLTLAEAMKQFGLDPSSIGASARRRDELLAYVELHIEQGPVLEAEGLPVGVVSAINGFSRLRISLRGQAGHAGTVPMNARRDALAAAAECIVAVERIARSQPELVGTVGSIQASPGAINVVPGDVQFTLDVRAPDDAVREKAVAQMLGDISAIASKRSIASSVQRLQDQRATACADWLTRQLISAVEAEGIRPRVLPSGAGHDGMAVSAVADIAMLFVRCKGGISHHPDEAITAEDAATGARVLLRFLEQFSR
jgi:allantoate deiminase